ncbi:LON peptidase substrate-binding domain-containing protein [Candidatus Poriferisocius sp.]|uniref:LON peptidase substrate-binding domain-containing protein n=1 Tax=Candidatus Poriferisocius sp. TaxID=3101276 RepID=UPI003B599EA9
MTEASPMAMFPLGMVLLPSMIVPLHVFEPRYRAMTKDCLDGDRQFGVALIERGSEVGGGDVRSDAGTAATIVAAEEFPDGRWRLVIAGTRRIRIDRWLPDDPYPRAEVRDWPDASPADGDVADSLAAVAARTRQVLALQSELGGPGPPIDFELADDPAVAQWQLASMAPAGPWDRQRLLTAETGAQRLELLAELLSDAEELIRARIEMG